MHVAAAVNNASVVLRLVGQIPYAMEATAFSEGICVIIAKCAHFLLTTVSVV